MTSRLATERLPRPLLVIDKSGALYLDEVPTSLPQRDRTHAEVASTAPSAARTLNVIADRTFPAQRFLDIVETVRVAGIPVRIVTLDSQAGG